MTVYVDGILEHGVTVGSIRGKSCHMMADTPEELHAMARRIGLRREWCSDHTQPKSDLHYDLVPSKRVLAVKAGAVQVKREEMSALLHRLRVATRDPNPPPLTRRLRQSGYVSFADAILAARGQEGE